MNAKKIMTLSGMLVISMTMAYGMFDTRVSQPEEGSVGCQSAVTLASAPEEECEKMITDDKWWILLYRVSVGYEGYEKGDYLIKEYVCGDTVVCGKNAKILRQVIVDENYQEITPSPLDNYPKKKVRIQDDERVCFANDGELLTLMDFSLNPGDQVELMSENRPIDAYYTVVSVREMMLNGVKEKVLVLWYDSHWIDHFLWISGVGSPTLNHICTYPFSTRKMIKILKCFKGNECIYSEDDYDMLLQSGVNEINMSAPSSDNVRFYNLQGMPVTEPRRGEIYILRSGQDSKKIIF